MTTEMHEGNVVRHTGERYVEEKRLQDHLIERQIRKVSARVRIFAGYGLKNGLDMAAASVRADACAAAR